MNNYYGYIAFGIAGYLVYLGSKDEALLLKNNGNTIKRHELGGRSLST
jgi:hypothetical protein